MTRELKQKLKRVKLLLCDVDGVLTDGGLYMGDGQEMKRFHIPDGLGLRLLQTQGIKVGWVSRRPSPATTARAKDLKIDFLEQTTGCKVEVVKAILKGNGLTWKNLAYVGDDVVDIGVLKRAGAAIAVANGICEVKKLAHYVTRAGGGQGAVREVVDLILKAQNKWKTVIQEHSV